MAWKQSNFLKELGIETTISKSGLPESIVPIVELEKHKHNWSETDTAYWISKFLEFCDIDKFWKDIFLDPCQTIKRNIKNKDFTIATVRKLERTAADSATRLGPDALEDFFKWLRLNAGGKSWDFREIIKYYRTVLASRDVHTGNEWLLGDWRDHINKVPDNLSRLLLMDPPYGMDYNSDRRVDRRNPRKHDKIENDSFDSAMKEIAEALEATFPKLNSDAHIFCFCHWKNEHTVSEIIESSGYKVRGSLIWYKNNLGMGDPFTTFAPQHERILHAVKGSPILFERKSDVLKAKRINSDNHPTEKPVPLLKSLIECTTAENELIMDMFGGVASTHVAAKLCGRKYWGTEKVLKFFDIGKKRLEICDNQNLLW